MNPKSIRSGSQTRGFTLVEIMIVILIIGILLTIAIPNWLNSRTQGRVQTILANLRQIDSAKDQFAMATGLVNGGTVNDGADLCPNYLMSWPSGPVPGAYAANAVGVYPTFNGQTALQISAECALGASGCPF